jgi:uncharacterized protein (DUF924 family)
MVTAQSVVGFWCDAGPKRWFRRDLGFDDQIRVAFEGAHLQAACGAFDAWSDHRAGALALLLLLDQFPRHIYRGTAQAFATDPRARQVAEHALAKGFDLASPIVLQPFFYLPFEHHEDAASQARAVELFTGYTERSEDTSYLRFAVIHAELIARFGRFPHRNDLLGRVSTPEELDYLAQGGFRG